MPAPVRPVIERLADKFLVGDGCWEWTGAKTRGYGVFWVYEKHRTIHATHALWDLMVGPVPEGMWLLHHCDNPGCVRPDHLFLGRQKENMADCAKKGRNGGARFQASKTHCVHGHPFTEENTYRNPDGYRVCRECKREGDRIPGARPMATRTHCPQGHPYDEANTYRSPGGGRTCRVCACRAHTDWKSRQKEAS